jgi:hypothetical protein
MCRFKRANLLLFPETGKKKAKFHKIILISVFFQRKSASIDGRSLVFYYLCRRNSKDIGYEKDISTHRSAYDGAHRPAGTEQFELAQHSVAAVVPAPDVL